MTYLKSVARISKTKLNSIFKVFKSDVKVIKKTTKADKLYELCSDKYDLIDYSETEYDFEYSFNNVTTDKFELSLSKSMIKTYILMHFIPSNRSGVRKRVSYSNLAESLGISVVSVRNNIDRLVKLNLLWVSKADRGLYDIVIVDEYKNHSADNGGYITLSYKILHHLLSFDNVNELKLELKKLLWCDAKVNFVGANINFNKDNLLSILPDYIRPSKRNELLNSAKSMFSFENDILNYDAFETKEDIREALMTSYSETIRGFFELSKMPYSKYHADNLNNPMEQRKLEMAEAIIVDDLVGLVIQYNMSLVLKALQEMYMLKGGINKNEVENTGGYIRDKINEIIALNKTVI